MRKRNFSLKVFTSFLMKKKYKSRHVIICYAFRRNLAYLDLKQNKRFLFNKDERNSIYKLLNKPQPQRKPAWKIYISRTEPGDFEPDGSWTLLGSSIYIFQGQSQESLNPMVQGLYWVPVLNTLINISSKDRARRV